MTQERTADSDISSLESKARDLQKKGLLADVRDELAELDTTLSGLPARLTELRTRGYAFKSYLEDQVKSLRTEWAPLRTQAQNEIDRRVRDLERDLRQVEPAVRRLAPFRGRSLTSAQSIINQAKSELDSVERRVDAAASAVTAMFQSKQNDVREITNQLDECKQLLDWMDKASFGFRPGEAGVAAVKAQWLQDGEKTGPKGILFLTDQRIILEQREKVAKKKVLFITTASEDVQELQWEVPLGTLQEAVATEKRQALILKKERLTLKCKPPATVREVLLELDADSETWRALINRVITGDMDKERVGAAAGAAAPAAAVAAPIKAPSKCPSCGASLDITVVKGMTAVKCMYCGTSIPLT